MKKAYYIITILLSGFGTALFVMAAIASREEGVTALAGLIISAVAAAFLVLSVLGLKKDSAIKGIVLEKVGVLLIGFAVLLLIAGFANLDKIIGAFAFAIPASVGGVLCFRKGMRVVEKASEEKRIRNIEWSAYIEVLCDQIPDLRENLRGGASEADIQAAETEIGRTFPELLKGLYLTNDGDKAEAVCGMLLGFHFLSLEVMRSEWRRSYANTKWIPIGSDGGGNFIGVDLELNKNGTVGQVISFGRDEQGKTVLAENLAELFDRFTRIVCSEDFYIGEYDGEKVIVLGADDVEEGSYLTDYLKAADSVK